MKPIDEQDHYEVLEVSTDADPETIERAYRLTRSAYGDESMALYSIFGKDDAAVIRARIDEAYRVLNDPADRASYDAEVGIGKRTAEKPAVREPADLDALRVEVDEQSEDFDGAALRRARLRRGVELDQIADVTKVSVKYLTSVEEEAFDELPASVYVRGFVNAYARAIGLDARRATSSYMERVDAAREHPKRGLRSSRS